MPSAATSAWFRASPALALAQIGGATAAWAIAAGYAIAGILLLAVPGEKNVGPAP